MSLFGQTKRHSISSQGRRSPLPIFSANSDKRYGLSTPSPLGVSPGGSWFSVLYVPIPNIPFISSSSSSSSTSSSSASSSDMLMNGSTSAKAYSSHPISHSQSHSHSHSARRYMKLYLPIPPRLLSRLPRSTPLRLIVLLLVALTFGLFLLGFRKRPDGRNTWSPPFVDPSTVVLHPDEIASIWEWEVLSGHHPSLEQGTSSAGLTTI
jgi:WD repeat and SOF domain-containing protein 1